MKIKTAIVSLVMMLAALPVLAQTGGVRGVVTDRAAYRPVKDAKVTLYCAGDELFVYTGEDGVFEFHDIDDGEYRLDVSAAGYIMAQLNVRISGGEIYDLMNVSLTPDVPMTDFMSDDMFADFEVEDESGSGYEDVPSVLSASQDVFDNIASFSFSAMRFLNRGYESGMSDIYINGIRFNDALSGYTPYSLFSGLNEATREKEAVGGMAVSDYGVGGINGLTNVNAYASTVAKGYRFSVLTNSSTYRLRLMATYATGLMDNGWAFAASVSTRLGGNDYITGVYYNAFAYFLAAEKRLNDQHRFSLTLFGSPVQRGAQNASTQEVYDLVGTNYYNSNWGYQNGQVRNARVRNNHEPVLLFNYEYTPFDDLKVSAGVSWRFGRNGYSALDWYDAPDPRPDYYKYLPSNFEGSYYDPVGQMWSHNSYYDPAKQAWAEDGWRYNSNVAHINWDRLYDVNRNSYFDEGIDYNPSIDVANAHRSKYILEERRTDQNDVNVNAQVTKNFGSILKGSLGYNFRWNRTEYYKIVKDLIGGDYWLNIDQFAERDFGSDPNAYQNDLDNPNRVVKEGEKYGYDYYANIHNHKVWTSWDLNVAGFEAVLGGELGYNTFWREGMMRKGLFPDNSLGNSEKLDFLTYKAKLGLYYKFSPQNMIYANVGYMTQAPYFDEAFLSPRTRNSVVEGLTTEKIFSADINYMLKTSWISLRVSAFYTTIKDQTDLISFYDDIQRAYTNFSMTGIDQRNVGIEAGIKVPIYAGLAFEGAVSWGNYEYTSNPNFTQTVDNSARTVLENETVYWSGFKVARTPHLASSIGLTWAGPGYLFAGLELNYFDGMYISMNPLRRTDYALEGLIGNELWSSGENALIAQELINDIRSQEKFPHAFVLNANIGKSWYIGGKYLLGVSANINNILNNRNIKTGGYEQMRLSRVSDAQGEFLYYKPFDSRYFYLHGINYMINVYFRF
ncbi:MAG TPA: TonB-dependent receptor [Candidatus Coprenecus pullistercoris]|nr:TonB-dependent receptor [Candidatus Coprenecus pullistercoris]